MKKIFPIIIFYLAVSLTGFAQTKEANPADVASLDAIMKAKKSKK